MITAKLEDMIGGWFVGDFNPSVLKTSDFEVSVKKYKKGDVEREHLHKLATEITVIVSGSVIMHERTFTQGDIIMLDKHEATSFQALTDAITVVVKTPSIVGDKYFTSEIIEA